MAYLNTAPYVTAEKWFNLFLCNRYCAYNFLWVICFQIIRHFWKKYIFGGNIGLFSIFHFPFSIFHYHPITWSFQLFEFRFRGPWRWLYAATLGQILSYSYTWFNPWKVGTMKFWFWVTRLCSSFRQDFFNNLWIILDITT